MLHKMNAESADFAIFQVAKEMGFFKINLAEGGLEAIKLMNIWRPDIILLDLMMPDLDGIATLRSIRAKATANQIPVIMITGSKNSRREPECIRMGANQVIFKPITLGMLNRAIQECFATIGMNRRKHLRARFDNTVKLQHNDIAYHLEADTLSEGGIFLYSDTLLAVGETATVTFEINGIVHSHEAEVLYHRPGTASTRSGGMALKYFEIKPDEATDIRHHVENIIKGKRQGRQ